MMTTLPVTAVLRSTADLLHEAYEGPPDASATWFVDNEPDAGLFGAIAGLSAREASTSMDGSQASGSTIASHVEHLRWSLANMNAAIRGEPLGEWKESWQLVQADDGEWDRLRTSLRVEYETLQDALRSQVALPEEYLPGVLSLLPHVAFHLGIIRQMIERVRL
jgi:hypothetical protein